MVLSLIGPLDNPRVQRILLVSAYAGTALKVVPITVGVENETDSYRRNCHPLARIPVLKSDEGYLFETHAIVRYIARTERPYAADGSDRHPSPQHRVPYLLYGKSLREAAEVDAWLDFVLTEIDVHAFSILASEQRQQPRRTRRGGSSDTTADHTTGPVLSAAQLRRLQESLEEGLRGLEQRLVFMKELRKVVGPASSSSVRASVTPRSHNDTQAFDSARAGTLDEVDDGLSEEEMFLSVTPRDSVTLRGSYTYNIKTRMEVKPDVNYHNNSNNSNGNDNTRSESTGAVGMGDGNLLLSSLSIPTPRTSTQTPRRSSNPPASDLLFLVGDSLTAADLVVASAVNNAVQLKCVQPCVWQQYPQLTRYVHGILRLPLAAAVRKALGVGLV